MKLPDVDIDTFDRNKILAILPKYIQATIVDHDGDTTPHKTGIYVQDIPYDPLHDLSAIEHKNAEDLGYFKIDILNLTAYNAIHNEDHLNKLLEMEPVWEMLEIEEVVQDLVHIGRHYDIVNRIKPKSISDLAIVLALIRPAKRHLLYSDFETIKREIWIRDDSGYYFSKSHAIAYAHLIVVQMNLLIYE